MSLEHQVDPAMIRAAIHQTRDTARQIGDLQAANARTIRTLETAFNQAIQGPVTGLYQPLRRARIIAARTAQASRLVSPRTLSLKPSSAPGSAR